MFWSYGSTLDAAEVLHAYVAAKPASSSGSLQLTFDCSCLAVSRDWPSLYRPQSPGSRINGVASPLPEEVQGSCAPSFGRHWRICLGSRR
eukprot:4371017-Heterocapsa_arctica.AAC.1